MLVRLGNSPGTQHQRPFCLLPKDEGWLDLGAFCNAYHWHFRVALPWSIQPGVGKNGREDEGFMDLVLFPDTCSSAMNGLESESLSHLFSHMSTGLRNAHTQNEKVSEKTRSVCTYTDARTLC